MHVLCTPCICMHIWRLWLCEQISICTLRSFFCWYERVSCVNCVNGRWLGKMTEWDGSLCRMHTYKNASKWFWGVSLNEWDFWFLAKTFSYFWDECVCVFCVNHTNQAENKLQWSSSTVWQTADRTGSSLVLLLASKQAKQLNCNDRMPNSSAWQFFWVWVGAFINMSVSTRRQSDVYQHFFVLLYTSSVKYYIYNICIYIYLSVNRILHTCSALDINRSRDRFKHQFKPAHRTQLCEMARCRDNEHQQSKCRAQT